MTKEKNVLTFYFTDSSPNIAGLTALKVSCGEEVCVLKPVEELANQRCWETAPIPTWNLL